MPEIVVRRHPTLEDCLKTFLRPDQVDDPSDWYLNEHDSGLGRKVMVKEYVDFIRTNMKCWGHCKSDTGEVSVWIDPEATDEDVLFLLGHELGHIEEEPPIKIRSHEDFEEHKERRADSYGRVASAAWVIWRALQSGETEVRMKRDES